MGREVETKVLILEKVAPGQKRAPTLRASSEFTRLPSFFISSTSFRRSNMISNLETGDFRRMDRNLERKEGNEKKCSEKPAPRVLNSRLFHNFSPGGEHERNTQTVQELIGVCCLEGHFCWEMSKWRGGRAVPSGYRGQKEDGAFGNLQKTILVIYTAYNNTVNQKSGCSRDCIP